MDAASFIPYTRHEIRDEDVRAVVDVLRADFITQGPRVAEFERAIAARHGGGDSTVVNSATAALHVMYRALGVGPGDVVVTTPITFVATANAALYNGARIVFSDIDRDTWSLCPAALDATLALAKRGGLKVKLVVPVHLAGLVADTRKIVEVTRRHFPNALVAEDAAHAIGADGLLADGVEASVFSFHPAKHVACGEGGAVFTRNAAIHARMQKLRSHGMNRTPAEADGPWYYDLEELGWNYRLPDFACALGLSQLGRLDSNLARRRAIARKYRAFFSGYEHVRCQGMGLAQSESRHSYHLFPVIIDWKAAGTDRVSFVKALSARGIGTQVHYIPLTRFKHIVAGIALPRELPNAEDYYKGALSLPMYHGLSDQDLAKILEVLNSLL